jgi:DNA-binding transcriptional regulator GbsR (MarR family)
MFQQSLKLIASCEELNGTDLKVFMFLLSELDFENYIRVTQKRITEHTKIKQQHVSTALTKLTKLNIIEKITLDDLKGYRLNPSYAWKGKISEFQKDEKERKKRAASETKIVQLKQKVTTDNEPQPPSD